MTRSFRNEITKILIITFLFFLIPADTFSKKEDEKSGLKLIIEAEKLFVIYDYQGSIIKFNEALKLIKSEMNLSRLYLGISRSYYALGLLAQVREAINKLALLTEKSSIQESEYPRGYVKIYNSILAEIGKRRRMEKIEKTEMEPVKIAQAEKTGEETKTIPEKEETPIIKKEEKTPEEKKKVNTKKSIAGVIEKPGVKKKRKKSLILPIIIGAAALGAAAMLMGKKTDGGGTTAANSASVHINSTPSGATVFVDGANKGVVTPCDISVIEGSREIRLQISGWGETITTKDFVKDNSYTLNAQLAPYKYHAVLTIVHPAVNRVRFDSDHSGNLYGIYALSGTHYMVKYDPNGIELFNRSLDYGGFVSDYPQVYFDNHLNRLYIFNSTYSTVYSFDTEAALIGGPYFVTEQIGNISENNSGEFYITNWAGSKVNILNSNFKSIGDLINSNTHYSNLGIKCSDDGQSIFIGSNNGSVIKKYDLSINLIREWSANSGFKITGYVVTSYGEGDLEKVFAGSKMNDNENIYRVEIFTGNGDFLTATENQNYIYSIGEDNSYNFFISFANNICQKFEPGPDTEGDGLWESFSSISNRMGIRTGSSSRITPLRNRRPGKSDINKEKDTRRKIK